MSIPMGGVYTAAITALEGQRTAYERYAKMVETQRQALSKSDPDRLLDLARTASTEFQKLEEGARKVRPRVEELRAGPELDPRAAGELQRVLESVRREAARAEEQIRELTQELEKWRDETGRRLQEMGEPLPGAREESGRHYGPQPQKPPMLLDRTG